MICKKNTYYTKKSVNRINSNSLEELISEKYQYNRNSEIQWCPLSWNHLSRAFKFAKNTELIVLRPSKNVNAKVIQGEILIQGRGSCRSQCFGLEHIVLIIVALKFRRRTFDHYRTSETDPWCVYQECKCLQKCVSIQQRKIQIQRMVNGIVRRSYCLSDKYEELSMQYLQH